MVFERQDEHLMHFLILIFLLLFIDLFIYFFSSEVKLLGTLAQLVILLI